MRNLSHKYDTLKINYQDLATKNLSLKSINEEQCENISKLSNAINKNSDLSKYNDK
jgi:hypothetical protein